MGKVRMALVAMIFVLTSCLLFSCAGGQTDTDEPVFEIENSAEPDTSLSVTPEPVDMPVELESSEDKVPEVAAPEAAPLPEGSSFKVVFLDVGQGDSALVECDGHYMLIDGGPADASSLLYTYLSRNGITHLDYLVATHPDTDHTGGISGALQVASVGRALCSVTEAQQKSFNSMVRYLGDQGVSLEVPKAGDSFSLGSASVSVVGPVKAGDDTNENSVMLRVGYGDTSFLFAGDASSEEEQDSVNAGYELESDVLKVSHHGSAYSTSYPFVRAVNPAYAVISVGEYNAYGHPTDEALSKLRDCSAAVYRTDLQGDITAASDGKTVTLSVAKNPGANTLIAPGVEAAEQALSTEGYIGNANSKKFHLPTCRTLPAEHNRVHFANRSDATDAGYVPCKNCNP